MDDDDFGTDADFLAALAASEAASRPRVAQPTPQKITQPTPQRLDRAPPTQTSSSGTAKVTQPTPQAIPNANKSASSILVSPRQKGNPILTHLRSFAWEYSDIVADYGLGLTTCALFLSLKYHRLHPDYIYTRVRNLRQQYNLRIVLAMVDIPNHEEVLKELAKTSVVNGVTLMLCWSAQEAARYLELYKSYEFANASAIREQRGTSYADRMVDFVTVPRAVNKTDAVSLVSAFGTVRNAVNARMEEVVVLNGWGEKKVMEWEKAVTEPFRVRRAKRRRGELGEGDDAAIPLSRVPFREHSSFALSREATMASPGATPLRELESGQENQVAQPTPPVVQPRPQVVQPKPFQLLGGPDSDDEEAEAAMADALAAQEQRKLREARAERRRKDDEVSDGIAAALAKLRNQA